MQQNKRTFFHNNENEIQQSTKLVDTFEFENMEFERGLYGNFVSKKWLMVEINKWGLKKTHTAEEEGEAKIP